MAEISKPSNLSLTWASGGDILDPGDTKYATGWLVEIPPRQWFNYVDNRQDEAIAHINQHGIAVWDIATEYQANKSYVTGSNGNLYKALTTNTNIDPTTDGGTNWQSVSTLPLATTAEVQGWTDTNSLISPSLLNLAFKGSNQSLTANGFQKIPGGLIIQWGTALGSGSGSTISYPIAFPTQAFSVVASASGTTATADVAEVSAVTATTFQLATVSSGSGSISASCYWIAVGF